MSDEKPNPFLLSFVRAHYEHNKREPIPLTAQDIGGQLATGEVVTIGGFAMEDGEPIRFVVTLSERVCA